MKPNPIYVQAAEAAKSASPVSIGLTETAKLIRAVLKARFSGVKFSVRSSRYAGGSSIHVDWIDGPVSIDKVISAYSGAGFDGMIDMQYSKGAWLHPDGSASFRQTEGTESSRGSVASENIPDSTADAIPVRFGANYVFGQRGMSLAQVQKDIEAYANYREDELSEAIRDGKVRATGSEGYAYAGGAESIRVGNDWGDTAIHRFRQGECAI